MIKDYHDFTWPTMPDELRKKMDVGPLYLNAIRCNKCDWFIRSRNRHDYVTCKCGESSVDGGSWYQKTSGDFESIIVKFKEIEK